MRLKMRRIYVIILIFTLLIPVISSSCNGEKDNQIGDHVDDFVENDYGDYEDSVLVSLEFSTNDMIPVVFTCDGEDISPGMSWSPGPEGTESYVLICEDPDAVGGTWVHWIIYNIPSDVAGLEENVPHQNLLVNGALQGKNDFGKIGYNGPCPPSGTPHHYYFLLYALDCVLDVPIGATKDRVESAMQGHVLLQASLVGMYGR